MCKITLNYAVFVKLDQSLQSQVKLGVIFMVSCKKTY